MATAINTLYPPVVSTFAKAFVSSTDAIVYYGISQYNSSDDIKRVHISVVDQTNNENALSDPSGFMVLPLTFDESSKMYCVKIGPTDISGGSFKINQYYKVQIRFDSYGGTTGSDSVVWNSMSAADKNSYMLDNQTSFSEWSSVCLLRPILQPSIRIKTFDNGLASDVDKRLAFNKGVIQIVGGLYFGDFDQSETETMQSYRIDVIDESSDKVITTSKDIYTGSNLDPNDINYSLDLQQVNTANNSDFTIRITCVTKNQYELSRDYKISIGAFIDEENFNPTITEKMDNENGIVTLRIKNENSLNAGYVYVKRLSSIDNFKVPETVYADNVVGSFDITLTDNTVSSLVWYKYSVQYVNKRGAGTRLVYSRVIMPDFYDAILSDKENQYRIAYNYSVSSYKPVVNRAKIDTLGGRYPRFAQNAALDYKQFSISGMISAESDVYQKFIKKSDVFVNDESMNYYDTYKLHPHDSILADSLKGDSEYSDSDPDAIKDIIRNDVRDYKKYDDFAPIRDASDAALLGSTSSQYLTTTQNDWLWEREFRERLIQWLNNGEPKLYRSMTEGSLVVMLTDISLQPVQNSSRFTYSFSATMYEMEDASSLDTLDSLGIYNRTINEPSSMNNDGGSGETIIDYIEVVKIGQLYNYICENEKTDIRNNILTELQTKYGKVSENMFDDNNVMSERKPSDMYLKNIKIYFQSAPNLYYFDTNGNPILVTYKGLDNTYGLDSSATENEVVSGYTFTIKTTASESYITIFVNEKGFYQIPDNLDVTSLSFNHSGDVVTVEYTMVYKESASSSSIISGNTIDRTVIGQYSDRFNANEYVGEKIRLKYNYIDEDGNTQYMQYWRGICLDVNPFALCSIQYKGQTEESQYLVGESGVLHLLKDFDVADMRFLGRRMTIVDKSRQKFLDENQCCYDDKEYASTKDVKKPKYNTVYSINDSNKIYYLDDCWYDFKEIDPDTTNVIGNQSKTKIGLASVPIDGQINYYGSVVESTY